MTNSADRGLEPDGTSPAGRTAWLAAPLAIAAAITAGLYVFGTQHTPDYYTSLFGQTAADTLPLKSWLGSALLALAGAQLLLGLWMYGRLPGVRAARGVATGHRAVGIGAFLLSLPIAYHCALAYGVQTSNVDTRVVVHSLAGCFFYGAFAAKVTIVRAKRLPGWTLPLAGGLLVTLVAVLWYTSALWYFDNYSLPSL
jgi:Family of unknown function (DUF6529)